MEFKAVLAELSKLILIVLTQVPTTMLQFRQLARAALEAKRSAPEAEATQ
jgi:hypothetical protein